MEIFIILYMKIKKKSKRWILHMLARMVRRCCEIKAGVVERDPKEQGERALLNLGHTIGHAVEKLMDFQLLHGQCVAIGLIAAAYISLKRWPSHRRRVSADQQGLSDFIDLPAYCRRAGSADSSCCYQKRQKNGTGTDQIYSDEGNRKQFH